MLVSAARISILHSDLSHAYVICACLLALSLLLPSANLHQQHISRQSFYLSINIELPFAI
jgi:hypothetical protein